MIDWLITILKENQIAGGGLVIMTLGAIGGLIYRIYPTVKFAIKKRLITEIDITSKTEAYHWFNLWLTRLAQNNRSRLLSIYTDEDQGIRTRTKGRSKKKYILPELHFSPAPGSHFFRYQGRFVWVSKEREKMKGDEAFSFALYEEYRITMLGRDLDIAKQMITEARDYWYSERENYIGIHSTNKWGEWSELRQDHKRKISTLLFNNNIATNLMKDIHQFLNDEQVYLELGIPYKRTFLFWGPPGTGKSSLIQAIAGEVGRDIYSLTIDNDTTNGSVISAIAKMNPNSILLIEDIDSLFKQRKKADEEQNLKFQTLLNIMDGVLSPYGVLIFVTTNNRQDLDTALTRPGRVDRDLRFDLAGRPIIEGMFEKFFPSANGQKQAFASRIPTNQVPPSALQKHFMAYRGDPDAAVRNCLDILKPEEIK